MVCQHFENIPFLWEGGGFTIKLQCIEYYTIKIFYLPIMGPERYIDISEKYNLNIYLMMLDIRVA